MSGVQAVKSSREFRRIVGSGERTKGANLTTFTTSATGTRGRLGLSVRVRPHGSVVRNRVRRRLRAAFVEAGGPGAGRDVVVRADSGSASVDFQQLVGELTRALEGTPG